MPYDEGYLHEHAPLPLKRESRYVPWGNLNSWSTADIISNLGKFQVVSARVAMLRLGVHLTGESLWVIVG